MALPTLSPEQRQAALEKARGARAARSALLAGLKAGTLTLADVLARDDDIARRTSVAQDVRALPGVGPARAAAAMEPAGSFRPGASPAPAPPSASSSWRRSPASSPSPSP